MALQSELSQELQIIAKNELNEIPSRIENDIKEIRKWVTKQPHIRARLDDHSILLFLRSCKYSLEKTKKKLELFYTVKTAFTEFFKNRNPFLPQFQYVFEENLVCALPVTSNGPMSILVRTYNANPDILPVWDIIKIATMIFDVLLREYDNTSVVGQAVLVDFQNIPIKYLIQATPTFLKKIAICFENAYPSRVKGVYGINMPPAWATVVNILKSFLSKKLRDRVFCFSANGDDTIEKYFSSSVLPTEYGGYAGSFENLCGELKKKINKYSNWFLDDEQFGCTKQKEFEYSPSNVDLFGLDGSFRKLEID